MVTKKKVTPKTKPKSGKKIAARKKTTPVRRKKQAQPQQPPIIYELKKIFIGTLVLVSICLTMAMVADIFLRSAKNETDNRVQDKPEKTRVSSEKQDDLPVKVKKVSPGLKHKPEIKDKKLADLKNGKKIKYEIFENADLTRIDKVPTRIKDSVPKIAIIIDDIGYDRRITMALFDLHPDITFSVLPFSPFGRQLAERLHKKGAQLMLHLPMEPVQYPDVDPGPGALLSTMPPDVLLAQLDKSISEIPNIIGVNNHMGSRLTANSNQMNQIFTILKKKGLFFIDSRTAPKSQGKASARLLRLKFATRDVFLDNFQESAYITGQFEELVDLAKQRGFAIGIGHPYPATLETLAVLLPKYKDKVKIVRANELTYIP